VFTVSVYPDTSIAVGQQDTLVAHIVSGGGTGTPTYQWIINGNPISGATTDTFTFELYFERDSIVCEVTSGGMCGGITSQHLTIITLKDVGVPQVTTLNSDIRLVPNPNKGAFSLKGTLGNADIDGAYIEVTNMLGQVVYKEQIKTPNGMVDEQVQLGSSLANGMYLLNLRSGAGNSVFHFVIEQ